MPNRTICSVLESMRKSYETRNFSGLLGLIEEAQDLANRMESALEDQRDIKDLRDKRSELKKEYRELKDQVKKLKIEKAKLEGKEPPEDNTFDYFDF